MFAAWAAYETPAVFVSLYSIVIALDGKVSVNLIGLLFFFLYIYMLTAFECHYHKVLP